MGPPNRLYFISSIAMYCYALLICTAIVSAICHGSCLCMIFHVPISCQGFLAQTWYNDVQCTREAPFFGISLDRRFNWNLTNDIAKKTDHNTFLRRAKGYPWPAWAASSMMIVSNFTGRSTWGGSPWINAVWRYASTLLSFKELWNQRYRQRPGKCSLNRFKIWDYSDIFYYAKSKKSWLKNV